MARIFILFLIALLPLRGWTAERMVFSTNAVPVALMAQAEEAALSEDCALHLGMNTDQSTTHHASVDGSGANHKGCESCQLCMPLVALDATATLASAALPETLPIPRFSHFVSADPARDVKPPIS